MVQSIIYRRPSRSDDYRNPKGADLGDVADEIGVSKSAVSQRLKALERKMMVELIDSCVEECRSRPASPQGDG
ncbi:helix-turn-helix domain-containing protein [Halalkaliarchaeum desulfuricum]|uniref:helix-turn-helix domain-containing protein n=1 Tax=Halalkaliarchaeum desulfuricum TaxID=2055893 RepID=UPI000E6CC3C9